MKNQTRNLDIPLSHRALALLAALLLSAVTVPAQQLFWDPSGATTGATGVGSDGAGVWDTSTTSWIGYNPTLQAWVNGGATAEFGAGGAGGEVTVSAPIQVGGINFNPVSGGNYDLGEDAAGDTLTLGGAITMAAGVSASISCPMVGNYSINGNPTAALTINVTTNAPDNCNVQINNGNALIVVGGTTGNYGVDELTMNSGSLTVSDNMQGPGFESVSNVLMNGGVILSAPTGGSVGGLQGYSMFFAPGGSNAFGVLQINGDFNMDWHSPVFYMDLNTTNAAIGTAGANCQNDYMDFTGTPTGNNPLSSLTFDLNFVGPPPASGTQLTYTVLNYNGPVPNKAPTINLPDAYAGATTQWGTNGTQYTITVNFAGGVITPPVVPGCPANITVSDDGSGTGATVNFTFNPSGGCTTPTVVAVPASGSRFPDGTTTVNCTASDTCGNSNTCSFTVTVNSLTGLYISGITNNGDGSMTLTYNATGGTEYDVQYATSLLAPVQWTTIPAGNNTPAASGPVSFNDPNAATTAALGGQVFYRIISP